MKQNIPQLRVRTEFSFRKTFAPIGRVGAALAELGAPAAGIVDPGTWGHVRWAKQAEKSGFKPLFGTELTFPQEDGKKPTAWFLATNTKGFYRFSSAARQQGADLLSLVDVHGKDLVRFSGQALLDHPDLIDYVDIDPSSSLLARKAVKVARHIGKPLVLTSDNWYAAETDQNAFAAIVGGQRATPQHLLSLEEMRKQFRFLSDAEFSAAVANTFEAAERCANVLPTAPIIHVPGNLRELAEAGRDRRLALGHLSSWPEEYEARFNRELNAIREKDFDSYFIVVADLISWAKQRMLVGPGRGSSAGSLVCYCLGITEVDPMPHGLLFERFIDMTRADLPDIDIDFSDTKRDMVFGYLEEKYGKDCVARIGNLNTLKPRSALAEVCKRLGVPDHERFNVLNVLIEYSSGDSRYGHSLEDTLTTTVPGREFTEKFPAAMVVREVENHAWHTGVHAAGVIVCNEPVVEYCTVDANGVGHIDKPDSEYLNLLKIDALGLTTLGIIEDANVVTGDQLYALKLDDPEVLRVFNEKKFSGIFQFEGNAQRSVSAQIVADSFRTLDHVTALARPGPLGGGAANKYINRKAGREETVYTHPVMESMLSDTYGVVLYQEQVMRIVREVGKFSWADTTVIRKAMSGRKGREFFDQQGEKFIAGAAQDGIDTETAQAIWNEICSFGAWGMNRCVAGSSKLKLCHPNQFLGPDPTIADLYQYYKVNPSAWIRQQKLMPVLMALGEDGVARPRMATDIIKTGLKPCVRLTFASGEVVECTKDHKFIINGAWSRCGEALTGDKFSNVTRKRWIQNHIFPQNEGKGHGWRAGRSGGGKREGINLRTPTKRAFRRAMIGSPCQDCGQLKRRMEVHHNDHKHGLERPGDLAWLCSGCHKKRHIEAGDWLPPYARGWTEGEGEVLISVEEIGERETYDIEMPDPDHNYLLANGIVTHNSHTCAYAVISYWCAWMKRYHPLEFAAACLRSAKDEEHTMAILREMADEGVDYVAFDPLLSEAHWSVQKGKLVGGFRNLVGYGPVKARTMIEKRAAGTLTEKDIQRMQEAHVKFSELCPLRKEYAALLNDPEAHGCRSGSRFVEIADMPSSGEVLMLGRVVKKEMRDENETVRVQKRGGRMLRGNTLFADLSISDDSGGPITVRIDRFNWEPLGRKAAENLVVGKDVIMIRGKRIPNFNMVKATNIKCLTNPEALHA